MTDPASGREPGGIARRDFFLRSAHIGGVFLPWAASCMREPRYSVPLADIPSLREVGSVSRVRHGRFDFFLVRAAERQVIALRNDCSHRHCRMEHDLAENALVCPCHGSYFDLTGRPTRGPAKKPIKRYRVDFSNGIVRVFL